MNTTERISGWVEPRSRTLNSGRGEASGHRTDAMEKPRVPDPIRAPEPIRRSFQARLNYDPVEADVFIEILDPETGEVLRRLPAEQAADDETANRGGTIFSRLA